MKNVLSVLALIMMATTTAFADDHGGIHMIPKGVMDEILGYSRTTLAEDVPCFEEGQQPTFLEVTSDWTSPEGFTTGPHHGHEVRQLEGDGYIVQQQRERLFGDNLTCTQTVIYETVK